MKNEMPILGLPFNDHVQASHAAEI